MKQGTEHWVKKNPHKYETVVNRMLTNSRDAVKRTLGYNSLSENEKRMAFFYLLSRASSYQSNLVMLEGRIRRLEDSVTPRLRRSF